jgi:hypothetical protein
LIDHRSSSEFANYPIPTFILRTGLDRVEEGWVDCDVLDDPLLGADTQVVLLQEVTESVAIDEFYWLSAIAGRFGLGLFREDSRSDQQALVTAPRHGPSEVSNLRGSDVASVTLALEEGRKGNERRHSVYPRPIDAAVTGSTRDVHIDKSSLTQQPLREPFEGVRGHLKEAGQEDRLPVVFSRPAIAVLVRKLSVSGQFLGSFCSKFAPPLAVEIDELTC